MARVSATARAEQLRAEEEGRHLYANRVRVYPKAVHGPVRRFKWAVLIVCLTIYYVLPWLRWNRGPGRPDQALLLSIADRRFYFFDLVLWPQDIFYLTGFLILCAVGLFLVTSLMGRVWCGYTCPQTVWTDLFMWVERLTEGDRTERMRRDARPMSLDTAWRKALKHALWVAIAFWTGGAWIMYFVDAPTAVGSFWIGTASTAVYGFTALFTASTYLLAGWAREQVCTFMCPWPRFQAAMFDEQSFIVTYQAWRGEPRGHVKAAAKGDCIDCGACVTACPTGIDIRDGVQLECIGCGLCIDACNDIMTKTAREPWLITWDSLARQNAKANARTASGPAAKLPPIRLLRPRTIIYATAMVLALTVMSVALATRSTISLSLQQDRAPLFVRLPDGSVRNGFTVKIVNKTQMDAVFDLDMHGLGEDTMALAETHTERGTALVLPVAADQVGSFRVLVTAFTHGEEHPVDFTLHDRGTGQTVTAHALFHGPGRIERHDEHDD
jgi:cytochrome c oxidase accessory protein FixG